MVIIDRIDTGVYISSIPASELNLQDFVNIRSSFCSSKHNCCDVMCKECTALVNFAHKVQKECVVELATAYKFCFPLVNYKADQAIRKLMQMPVTTVHMSLKGPGSQRLYVLESMPGVDLKNVVKLAEKCFSQNSPKTGITKAMLQNLCRLATNESDSLLIKYACCKGQNLTQKKPSELYGFSNFNSQESNISSAILKN